jgi:hypothetical protein
LAGAGGPEAKPAGRARTQAEERITQLEQHNADLTAELSEREEDLVAARAANRQLMATLNARS